MIIHPPLILSTEMRQLHGARVPRVLDAINMHRRDINLEAARKARVVQTVYVRWLQRRRQAKRIVVVIAGSSGPRYLVTELIGAVPETAVHRLSRVAGFHERFDLLTCSAGLLMQLFTGGVVYLPGGGRNGQAHAGKNIKGDATADEDGGFEGEGLFRLFIFMMEDEGGYDSAALREAEDCVIGFPLLVYVGEEPLMGFGDVARVDGLPECVVGRWKEGFDAPGGARLVGAVDEVEGVFLGVKFGAEGS